MKAEESLVEQGRFLLPPLVGGGAAIFCTRQVGSGAAAKHFSCGLLLVHLQAYTF